MCCGHLACAHGLHQTYSRLELNVPLAFDVGAKLSALQPKLLKRRGRDDGACECGADDAVEYVCVGIDDGVADVEHVQRQAVFNGTGN